MDDEGSSDMPPPSVFVDAAKSASKLSLPAVSRARYEAAYDHFTKWKTRKKVESLSENVLLAYFTDMSEKCLPSSIWSKYSMLRSTMKIEDKIDIGQYSELLAFIKTNSKNFQGKKAKILTSHQIQEFLNRAPNETYLAVKVSMICWFR